MKKITNVFIRCIALLIAFSMVTPIMAAELTEKEQEEEKLKNQFAEFPAYTDTNGDLLYETGAVTKVGLTKYTDVTDEKLAETLTFLHELGIIDGFEDGTFKPDNYISRSECAYITLRVRNQKNMTLRNGITYYDVDSSHPLYDAIMTASALGVASGYSDGNFRPNQPIKKIELVVFLMRALGYEALAEQNGGFYKGYISAAAEAGITLPNDGLYDDYISRGDAARLIKQILFAPILKQNIGGKEGYIETTKTEDVLSEFHNIYEAKGQMKANNVSGINMPATDSNCVNISGTVYELGNSAFKDFLGYSIKYYYIDDDSSNIGKVVYATKSSDVRELEIKAKNLNNVTDNTINYYDENGKDKVAKLDSIYEIIENGVHITDWDDSVFDINNGTIRLLSNTGSNIYNMIYIDTYENIVNSYIGADGTEVQIDPAHYLSPIKFDISDPEINLELYDATGAQIDFNVSSSTSYNADGIEITVVSLPPIPTGAVLSIYADKYDLSHGYKIPSEDLKTIKIKVSDKSVTGKVDSMDLEQGKKITVDGVQYDVADNNFLFEEDRSIEIGKKVKLLLDIENNVVDWEDMEDESGWQYGFLISATVNDETEIDLRLKYLTADDKIAVNNCQSKLNVNGARVYGDKALLLLKNAASLSGRDISQLFKYKISKENLITSIQTITAQHGIAEGYPADQLNRDLISIKDDGGAIQSITRSALRTKDNADGGLYYDYYGSDSGSKNPDFSGASIQGAYVYAAPKIRFVVPVVESSDEELYAVLNTWKTEEPKNVEIYDVSMARVPQVLVAYEDVGDRYLYEQRRCMYISTNMSIGDDGAPVQNAVFCDGMSEITIEMENPEALGYNFDESGNPQQYIERGDVVYLKGKNGVLSGIEMVISIDEVKQLRADPGKVVLYDTKRDELCEIYLVEGRWMRIGRGPVNDETGVRAYDAEYYWTTNTAVLKNSAIIYDEIDRAKPDIRIAQISDVHSAYQYGFDNASIAFLSMKNSDPTGVILYNFED